jgi:hypothetical protein
MGTAHAVSAADLLWEPDTAAASPTLSAGSSAGLPVQINLAVVAQVTPGALVELPFGTGSARFQVQRVVVAGDARTIYGSSVQGGAYPLVMTVGEGSSYATFSTAKGTFSLRGGPGGAARLYSAAELNRHRDYTLRDYITVQPDLEGQ